MNSGPKRFIQFRGTDDLGFGSGNPYSIVPGYLGDFSVTSNLTVLVAAGLVYWFFIREDKKGKVSKYSPRSEEGWYAIGYNYPEGHPDRRIKLVMGPYTTKARAEQVGKSEDAFYIKIAYRKTSP